MTNKHFTQDFRREAARLALDSDLSRHQPADDLGVGHSFRGGCWVATNTKSSNIPKRE